MTDIFFDKRDKDYYQMRIRDHLFEVFRHKTKKFKVAIPATVSVIGGKIENWFFNSKKEAGNPILMRNSDKLIPFEVVKYFANLRDVDDKPSLDQTIKRFQLDLNFHKECAFVRFNNGEKLLVNGNELASLLNDRISNIKSIQSIVHTQSKIGSSANVLLCEYRSDKDDSPPSYSFIVKTRLTNHHELYNNKPELFDTKSLKRVNMEYLYKVHIDNIESSIDRQFLKDLYGNESDIQVRLNMETRRGYINKNHKTSYYKSMDQKANNEASKLIRELALYMETTHRFRVKKLICAFIFDVNQKIYLLSVKELLFDFLHTGVYSVESAAGTFRKGASVDFNELLAAIQMADNGPRIRGNSVLLEHNRKIAEIKQDIIQIQNYKERIKEEGSHSERKDYTRKDNETESNERVQTVAKFSNTSRKPFSNILLSKLRPNQCQGDFCEFYIITNSQDDRIEAELQKQQEGIDSYCDLVRKPFQISNALRMKCREHLKETLGILREHQIVPRLNSMFINPDEDNETKIMAFLEAKVLRKDVNNLENLYRSVRVCKPCYTVYHLMSEYFEKTDGGSYSNGLPRASQSQISQRVQPVDSVLEVGSQKESILFDRGQEFQKTKGKKLFTEISERKGTMSRSPSKKMLGKRNSSHDGQGAMGVGKELRNLSAVKGDKEGNGKFASTEVGFKIRRSNSTLTNTRLLHGILQKVNQPKIMETEKKVLMERELMKKGEKREGKYIHNLLDIVGDSRKPLSERRGLLEKELESGNRKTSILYQEVMKDLQREKEVLMKDDPQRYKSQNPDAGRISYDDLRRRMAIKLEELKKEHNTAPVPKGYDAVWHKSVSRVNTLSDYRLGIPRQFNYELNDFEDKSSAFELKTVSFTKFCEIRNMDVPSIPQVPKIEVLVLDPKTAIPFMVLSPSNKTNSSSPDAGNVVVVVHDMFHSFLEDIPYYEDIVGVLPNTKIVLFNYPGQAFTSYDANQLQTNEELAGILDILLNFLYNKKYLAGSERLSFVGVGYGGNIVSCFLCYNNHDSSYIDSVLIINSFITVDEEIDSMGREWIATLQGLPSDIPEIHFNHYYVMALNQEKALSMRNEQEMRMRIERNPIKPEGKVFIMKGLLESLDISENFKKVDVDIYVVHSLNNCIFRSSNAEKFMQKAVQEDALFDKKPKSEKKGARKLLYYEGGHDIATESPESLRKIIIDFVLTDRKSASHVKAFSLLKTAEIL